MAAEEYHILVVDDNTEILHVIREILRSEGYHVQISTNGACLRHLERDLPDVILLDVLLEGEDGRELCRDLKCHEHTREIPVILFSASIMASDHVGECGADEFLSKPFQIAQLLHLVARMIAQKQQEHH